MNGAYDLESVFRWYCPKTWLPILLNSKKCKAPFLKVRGYICQVVGVYRVHHVSYQQLLLNTAC